SLGYIYLSFFFQAEDGIRDFHVTGVQTCALPISNQGVASELRGERVRTYRSETLIAETAAANPDTFRLDVAGLPANFMPLFAGGRGAFVPKGDQGVVHGGMSLEELIVPFVKVS